MAYDNSSIPASPPTPPRTVYTCKNTPFPRWREMVLARCADQDLDPDVITQLGMLHGWEAAYPPDFFVDIYVRRKAKDISRQR